MIAQTACTVAQVDHDLQAQPSADGIRRVLTTGCSVSCGKKVAGVQAISSALMPLQGIRESSVRQNVFSPRHINRIQRQQSTRPQSAGQPAHQTQTISPEALSSVRAEPETNCSSSRAFQLFHTFGLVPRNASATVSR